MEHAVKRRPAEENPKLAASEQPDTAPVTVTAGTDRHEDVSRYCPVCSQRLESKRCKLICPVCGYYMSCADYY